MCLLITAPTVQTHARPQVPVSACMILPALGAGGMGVVQSARHKAESRCRD